MRTKFELTSPDKMEATLTVTATVAEWKELRTQLAERWPSGELSRRVGDLVSQAEKVFYSNTPES